MKNLKFNSFWLLLMLGLATVALNSCGKEDKPDENDGGNGGNNGGNTNTIVGTWKYVQSFTTKNGITLETTISGLQQEMSFYKDGKLTSILDGEGTYTINGSALSTVTTKNGETKEIAAGKTVDEVVYSMYVKSQTYSVKDDTLRIILDSEQSAMGVTVASVSTNIYVRTATSISLNETYIGLECGEEYTLNAIIVSANATNNVTWTSSQPSVATVANGKIKALSVGETTITAKVYDKTATCTVMVSPITITISLNKTGLTLAAGNSETLTATVSPDYAPDKTVTWTSSNNAIATVVNGKVTAISSGTATITAKTGDETAICIVSVPSPVIAVVINGVTWASHNVDEPGTFTATPESAGKFYQWNRKKAWAATGEISGWNRDHSNSSQWTEANNPTPAGWRLPTYTELASLFNTQKVTQTWEIVNGVAGKRFTDKQSNASIFLPAAGSRQDYNGELSWSGYHGCYWSDESGVIPMYAYYLHFDQDGANMYHAFSAEGRTIRPVK